RRAAWPHADRAGGRTGAGGQHVAGRGPRLRDRAGPPRPRPHPPLHARDRRRRARARADVPAAVAAPGVWPPGVGTVDLARAHRPVALPARPGAADGDAGRADDGHRGQQGRARRDRDDQGDRAAGRRTGDRLGGAGARRGRGEPGHLPGPGLGAQPLAAPGRRTRRGASRNHRPHRAEEARAAGGRTLMGNPRRDIQSLSTDPDGRNPQLVNSVVRAFSILRCFERSRGHPEERYLGNQDIARRTRLPKATVSRLTQTLATLGYLEYAPAREKYALGPAVLGLGHAYMAGHGIVGIAQPLMQELAEYTRAAVMLAVPDGLRMLLLEV